MGMTEETKKVFAVLLIVTLVVLSGLGKNLVPVLGFVIFVIAVGGIPLWFLFGKNKKRTLVWAVPGAALVFALYRVAVGLNNGTLTFWELSFWEICIGLLWVFGTVAVITFGVIAVLAYCLYKEQMTTPR